MRPLPDTFAYRPGTADEWIMRESSYRTLLAAVRPTDVVLDVGAYIGSFATRAKLAGAAYVLAVEPVPASYELLAANARQFDFQTINAAVVPTDAEAGQLTLMVSPNVKSAPYSYARRVRPDGRQKTGYEQLTVYAYGLPYLQRTYRPTLVKLDVEGMEIELLCALDHAALRGVVVEYELRDEEHHARACAVDAWLVDQLGYRRHTPRSISSHSATTWAIVKTYLRD